MSAVALVLVTLTSLLLFVYGINLLYLSRRALSLRPEAVRSVAAGEELPVVVQLPVYNERYVAERVIDAAWNRPSTMTGMMACLICSSTQWMPVPLMSVE